MLASVATSVGVIVDVTISGRALEDKSPAALLRVASSRHHHHHQIRVGSPDQHSLYRNHHSTINERSASLSLSGDSCSLSKSEDASSQSFAETHYLCVATGKPLDQRVFHCMDVLPFGLQSPSAVFAVIGRHTNVGMVCGLTSDGKYRVRPYRNARSAPLQLMPERASGGRSAMTASSKPQQHNSGTRGGTSAVTDTRNGRDMASGPSSATSEDPNGFAVMRKTAASFRGRTPACDGAVSASHGLPATVTAAATLSRGLCTSGDGKLVDPQCLAVIEEESRSRAVLDDMYAFLTTASEAIATSPTLREPFFASQDGNISSPYMPSLQQDAFTNNLHNTNTSNGVPPLDSSALPIIRGASMIRPAASSTNGVMHVNAPSIRTNVTGSNFLCAESLNNSSTYPLQNISSAEPLSATKCPSPHFTVMKGTSSCLPSVCRVPPPVPPRGNPQPHLSTRGGDGMPNSPVSSANFTSATSPSRSPINKGATTRGDAAPAAVAVLFPLASSAAVAPASAAHGGRDASPYKGDAMERLYALHELSLCPSLALHGPTPPLRVGTRVLARRFGCDATLHEARVMAATYDATYTLLYEADGGIDVGVLHRDVHVVSDADVEVCGVRDRVIITLQRQERATVVEALGQGGLYRVALESCPGQVIEVTARHVVYTTPLLVDAVYSNPKHVEWFRQMDKTGSGRVAWKDVRHMVLGWESFGKPFSFQRLGDIQRDLCVRIGRVEPQLLRRVPVQEEEMLLTFGQFEYVVLRAQNLM